MKLNYISTLNPSFVHDCESCVFHGSLKVSKKTFGFEVLDFYTCGDEALVRFDDAPQDNVSVLLDIGTELSNLFNEVISQNRQPEWNANLIRERLLLSDKWVTQGVIRIYEQQTSEEQNSDATFENNGVGFNGTDALPLSNFAKFAIKTGFLTKRQMAYARNKMLKYSGQLARIANSKGQTQERKAA